MRELATADRIRDFMRVLGAAAESEGAVYFTGGASAVLAGWRESTIDVDVLFVPESDALLRSLPRIKDDLSINVELASPLDFIPVPAGWEERSPSSDARDPCRSSTSTRMRRRWQRPNARTSRTWRM